MQTLHTAAIHHLLGTPVRLDLGSTTGALIDISRQVGKLDRVSADTEGLPQRLAALGTHVSEETRLLRAEFKLALAEAADDIVERVGAQVEPQEPEEPAEFELGTTAVLLVRLLVQAQALAIAREPGAVDDRGDENVTLEKLGVAARRAAKKVFGEDDKDLHERFIAAFAPFTSTDPESRSERFVEMHALVEEIALHFGGE